VHAALQSRAVARGGAGTAAGAGCRITAPAADANAEDGAGVRVGVTLLAARTLATLHPAMLQPVCMGQPRMCHAQDWLGAPRKGPTRGGACLRVLCLAVRLEWD